MEIKARQQGFVEIPGQMRRSKLPTNESGILILLLEVVHVALVVQIVMVTFEVLVRVDSAVNGKVNNKDGGGVGRRGGGHSILISNV